MEAICRKLRERDGSLDHRIKHTSFYLDYVIRDVFPLDRVRQFPVLACFERLSMTLTLESVVYSPQIQKPSEGRARKPR